MKPYYYALVLSFFTTISTGQSKTTPQLHLTPYTLETLVESDQLKTKNQKSVIQKRSTIKGHLINFNEVISFKEESDYRSILTNFEDLSQLTVFTVYKPDEISRNSDLWMLYGEDSFVSLSTYQAENSGMQTHYEGGLNQSPLLNTYTQMYRSRNTNNYPEQSRILLGNYSKGQQHAFKGVIAEILIYNKVLRGKKRQVIETSLALKYGIPLTNGKDYLSSAKKSIYSMKDNDGFTNRIFGIGRDDKTSLYQKQSRSTAQVSLITVGLKGIEETNTDNKAELNNHTFLIFGDNNKHPIIETNATSGSQLPLMQRQWKLQTTGEIAPELSTTLELDTSLIFKEKKEGDQYLLVIDNSGDGSFQVENSRYIAASLTEINNVTFNAITWDIDGSGSDSFTFALNKELELALKEETSLNCDVGNNGVLNYEVNGGIPPYSYELSKDNLAFQNWKSTDKKYSNRHIEHLSEGTYHLKVTDAIGAHKELEYTLVSPNPITIDLGIDRQFSLDQNEIILDAFISSAEDIEYSWTSTNGFTSGSPKITIVEPGTYTVLASTAKGCKAEDSITIKGSFIESFTVFPNQSRDGNYTIQIKLSKKEDVTIKVFDMVGRHISTLKGKNQSSYLMPGHQIPTSGIYNIVLESTTQSASRKLIVD